MGAQEKAEELVVKELGSGPEVFNALKEYFRQLNELVHYYMDKFGPYMVAEQRKKLAELGLEADAIFVRLERIDFQLQKIYAEAKAAVKLRKAKRFRLDETLRERLISEINEIERTVNEFSKKVEEVIKDIIEMVNKRGIE